MTVGQWLDIWLEMRQTVRPATRRIYTQLIRDYIMPRLGGVLLRDLTIGKTQVMFTVLLRANEERVRPLAPATLQRIREVLRAALNGVIRRRLITQNPARWVEIPSASRLRAVVWTEARVAVWRVTGQRPPVAVWTAAQTAVFLAHVRGHVLYPLFHVAALLALRRGEVIGLRWSDVDFTAGTLTVCRRSRSVTAGRWCVCRRVNAVAARSRWITAPWLCFVGCMPSGRQRPAGRPRTVGCSPTTACTGVRAT